MKIVITGALGYVGSSLIRQVTKDFPSVQIILIDNLSTGRPQSLSGITNHKKIHFIEADILNFNFESLKLQKGDFVVHLAALSRPAESYERPQDYLKINYYGALRVAKSCAKSGSRFLFPSTTSVYHQTGGKLIDEESSHLRPQTPYAESKLTAEEKIKKIPALSFTIFRFGTIYGVSPSVSVHTAVNKFCWQASA